MLLRRAIGLFCLMLLLFTSGESVTAAPSNCAGRLRAHDIRKGTHLNEINMAYPVTQSIRFLDPQRIDSLETASLSRNLYSRLLSLDDDGNLSGDLADDMIWDGSSFLFHIRKGVQTVDGHEMNAHDVEVSLLRILRNSQAVHGNLDLFLCNTKDPNGHKICPGITVEGESVRITPKDPLFRTFLAKTLASIDFAIIPAPSLDLTKPEMPMKDWRNSSGLYFVAADDASGAYTLKLNHTHHRYDPRQAEQIHIKPIFGADAIQAFKAGEVDFVSTTNMTDEKYYAELAKDGARVFTTQPIQLSCLTFTPKGLKKFSALERVKIGLLIKAALHESGVTKGLETSEFFPAFSEGSLTESEKATWEAVQKQALKTKLHAVANFSTHKELFAKSQAALASVPEIKLQETRGIAPWLETEDQQPDVYFLITDAGFYESLSLLHYNINAGYFMEKSEGEAWIADFVRTESKPERIEKINQLHLDFLSKGRLMPLSMGSYRAVARAPYNANFSPFFAGTPLWNLIRD